MFITGYSGRFPNADSVPDLLRHLLQKKDLVSETKRYPPGFLGLPLRAGHLKTINVFDRDFFHLNVKQVEGMDIQIRLLLEVAFEAIYDAGYTMEDLRGTRTGVYVANCGTDHHYFLMNRSGELINGYENVGSARNMSSNRISYFLDLHGPSITIDTACSSSLVALDRACQDMEAGIIDRAIVGGCSLTLCQNVSKSFSCYNMLSKDGTCFSFDQRANGYCRSEAICAVLIETGKVRSEGYAKILGHGINSNGFVTQGITYPSLDGQATLFREVLKRSSVEAREVEFIEAHGTGTTAGDSVEINALDEVYGPAVEALGKPLALGSIKSNLGHTEGASGLVSIIKCLLMYETGLMLPNLHFESSPHAPIFEGRFRVITDVCAFNRGHIAVNNFGFGGTNAHVLLGDGGWRPSQAVQIAKPSLNSPLPRVYARTREEALRLAATMSPPQYTCFEERPCPGFGWRAVGTEMVSAVKWKNNNPSLVFVYSGQGSQGKDMGKYLLQHDPTFAATIEDLSEYLAPRGLDLVELFQDGSRWMDKHLSGIGLCSMQIALTRCLEKEGYVADYHLGHSVGEVSVSFADGCITAKQAIELAFERSRLAGLLQKDLFLYTSKSDKAHLVKKRDAKAFEEVHGSEFVSKFDLLGAMLFVASSPETIQPYLEETQIVIACYNTPESITLSGAASEIEGVAKRLQENGIMYRHVETDGIAYHHHPTMRHMKSFHGDFEKILRDPPTKPRTSKWISTSTTDQTTACDADYHFNNIVGSVLFAQAVAKLPENCVIVEIGPHHGLLSLIKKMKPTAVTLSCCSRGVDKTLDQKLYQPLWLAGIHRNGVPRRQYGVNERYNICWNHEEVYPVPYAEAPPTSQGEDMTIVTYDLEGDAAFLLGHKIQGTPLFPAMGYVYTLWKARQSLLLPSRKGGASTPFILQDIVIHRAIVLEGQQSVKLHVKRDPEHGQDKVYYGNELVAQATVVTKLPGIASFSFLDADVHVTDDNDMMSASTLYGLLARLGYEWEGSFQMIDRHDTNAGLSLFKSNGSDYHWIAYLDGFLQSSLFTDFILGRHQGGLCLPTGLKQVIINQQALESDPKGGLVRNMRSFDVIIQGLETSPAPNITTKYGKNSITTVQFIPFYEAGSAVTLGYDPHFISIRDRYVRMARRLVRPFYNLIDPGLRTFLLQQAKDEANGVQPDEEEYDSPLFDITRDLYARPDDFFSKTYLSISQHPLHPILYEKDALAFISPETLSVCVDVVKENCNEPLRVLEVGTGTGGALRRIYPLLCNSLDFYLATDVSNIETSGLPGVETCRWDMNSDELPKLEKGKGPQDFNIVFASNAVHCSPNISSMLDRLHYILRAGKRPSSTTPAYVLIEEHTSEIPLYLWGVDAFAWDTPKDVREYGLWMTHARWLDILAEKQDKFKVVFAFNNGVSSLFLLLARGLQDEASPRLPIQLRFNEQLEGLSGLILSLRKEPGMMGCYLEKNHELFAVQEEQGKIGTYRELLVKFDVGQDFPWHLKIEQPGNLSSLYYQQLCAPEAAVMQVHYAGLNFRDVMLSYGKLRLPELGRDGGISIGLECSGLTQDGRRVMGMGEACVASALPSLPTIWWEIPDSMNLDEAATIPCVYGTVYYALDHVVRLDPNQSILIHGGAGGVGQAAIRFCLARGLTKIYTTCSPGKVSFLKKTFGLTKDQIFNSRDLSFKDMVLAQTSGEGVDVVLNSLADEKLFASIDLVRPYGHFVEIGKYNIMEGTSLGMDIFKKNLSFHGIDLSAVLHNPARARLVHDLVQKGLDNKEIVPIHIDRVFGHQELADAMRYMGGGSHIGKIVIRMRDEETGTVPRPFIRPRFFCRGTHVITGGLGGFGFELGRWLVSRGAGRVLLLSRKGTPVNAYQRYVLQSMPALVPVKADCTDADQVKQLISADVTGIWHLAMVLKDALYEKMTKEQWDLVVNVKVQGARHLDHYSRIQAPQLSHFVMFSSVTSLYGNPGQTNYTYANSMLESLSRKRAAEGLPALAICWGIVGNVGWATIAGNKVNTGAIGMFNSQPIDECLEDLHTLLTQEQDQPVKACYRPLIKEMETNEMASGPEAVMKKVLAVLGLNLKHFSTCSDRTLGELGMDSLQVFSIQNVVNKHLELRKKEGLQTMELHEMTVEKLYFVLAAGEGLPSNSPKTTFSPTSSSSTTLYELQHPVEQAKDESLSKTTTDGNSHEQGAVDRDESRNDSFKDKATLDMLLSSMSHEHKKFLLASRSQDDEEETPQVSKGVLLKKAIDLKERLYRLKLRNGAHGQKAGWGLLLGATGYVGAHLLYAKLAAEPRQKIVCIVRATNPEAALSRIQDIMTSLRIWQPHLKDNIIALAGDMVQPGFGLRPEHYNELVDKVDYIIMAAGSRSWMSYTDSLGCNREGLVSLVSLAQQSGATIHHISSGWLDIYDAVENEEHRRNLENIPYVIIKRQAEEILSYAAKHLGVRCRIYRLPLCGPNHRGGFAGEFLPLSVMGVMYTWGIVPTSTRSLFPTMASDDVARFVVKRMRQQNSVRSLGCEAHHGGRLHLYTATPWAEWINTVQLADMVDSLFDMKVDREAGRAGFEKILSGLIEIEGMPLFHLDHLAEMNLDQRVSRAMEEHLTGLRGVMYKLYRTATRKHQGPSALSALRRYAMEHPDAISADPFILELKERLGNLQEQAQ